MVWLLVCAVAYGCAGKTAADGAGSAGSAGLAADAGVGGEGGASDVSPSQGGEGPSNGGAPDVSSQGGDSPSNAGAGEAGDGSSMPSATKQCQALATTLCARGLECTTGTNPSVCEAQLSLEFGCDWAEAADYSGCAQSSQSQSCEAVFPSGNLTLPAACLPPITHTPLSDAQTKCYLLVDTLCTRSIRCLGRIATAAAVQDCEDDVTTDLQNGLPCLLAATVGAGYASCVAAIPGLSCDSESAGGGAPMAVVPGCADALVFSP